MRATSEVSRRPPRGTRSVCVAQRGMSTGNGHMPAHLVCLCDAQLRAPVLCFAQEQPGSTPSTNGAHTHAHTHAHREWNGPTMSTISLRLSRSSCRPRTPPTPHTSSTAPAATWRRPARMLPTPVPFSVAFFSRTLLFPAAPFPAPCFGGVRHTRLYEEHKYCGRLVVPRLA